MSYHAYIYVGTHMCAYTRARVRVYLYNIHVRVTRAERYIIPKGVRGENTTRRICSIIIIIIVYYNV